MSRLFIEMYFDEDVSALVAALVRSRGFAVTTTLDAGNVGNDDESQLAYATARHLAIVTHNRVHFEQLAASYLASGRHHSGIIVAVRRRPQEITRRLLGLLDQVTADEMDDQLRYI